MNQTGNQAADEADVSAQDRLRYNQGEAKGEGEGFDGQLRNLQEIRDGHGESKQMGRRSPATGHDMVGAWKL